MHPLQSNSPLIVYMDFKSPYAYLAKDPTWQLEADFGIEVDWRPLTLNIPSFLGSAKVDATGRVTEQNRTPRQWQGVRYAYMDAKRYARLKDIQPMSEDALQAKHTDRAGLLLRTRRPFRARLSGRGSALPGPPASADDPLASRRKRRSGAPVASHEATRPGLQVP